MFFRCGKLTYLIPFPQSYLGYSYTHVALIHTHQNNICNCSQSSGDGVDVHDRMMGDAPSSVSEVGVGNGGDVLVPRCAAGDGLCRMLRRNNGHQQQQHRRRHRAGQHWRWPTERMRGVTHKCLCPSLVTERQCSCSLSASGPHGGTAAPWSCSWRLPSDATRERCLCQAWSAETSAAWRADARWSWRHTSTGGVSSNWHWLDRQRHWQWHHRSTWECPFTSNSWLWPSA